MVLSEIDDTISNHKLLTSSDHDGRYFTKSEVQDKLDGLNNYIHPTSDGNKHVPATGTINNGKVLKAGATAGTFAWATECSYTHPASHPASIITQDATHRFATDTEKSTWNAKLASKADVEGVLTGVIESHTHSSGTPTLHASGHITGGADVIPNVVASGNSGLMNGTDKTKLNGIATGANNYTHPSNHPSSVITQTSSARFVTDVEKSTWNGKADGAHNHNASSVNIVDSGGLFVATNVESAMSELFTSVSNGKNSIATAITGKGVSALGSDTFAQLASKIASISCVSTLINGTVQPSEGSYQFNKIIIPDITKPPKMVWVVNPEIENTSHYYQKVLYFTHSAGSLIYCGDGRGLFKDTFNVILFSYANNTITIELNPANYDTFMSYSNYEYCVLI